ncbi:MAG: hypothetical protein WDW38_008570 [Sanguina aurantia]
MQLQYEAQLVQHGQNQPQLLPPVLQQGLGRTGGWHAQADEEQRQQMATHIFNIFQQRRPTSEQYASRLPDFVRRLEDVLYKQAKSLAEYVDLGTLDHRLQAVALHFVGRPSAQVNASGSSPHATGSQGAPGHEMLHSSQQQQPQQALMGPNPVPSMSGGVPQMQQQQAQQQQQQQQVNTSYTPSNPSLNGNYTPQPAPAFSPGGGALRSNYMPMSMPGTAPAPADSSNPGSGFNPRQSPASMPANSVYGGNVPGLPVMSNGAPVLRNSANRDWMGQNLQQHGMNAGAPSGPLKGQMNGMVPSPQLSSGGMMPMPMPQGGNGPSSSMGNGFGALPAIPFLGSQGHQAPNHNPAGYDMGSLPATGASKMMPITSYHSPSSSSHHLVPVPSAAGGPGLGSSFGPQSSGGNGGALGPGPASGFVPQNGGISSSGPGAGGFGAGGNGGGSSAFGPSATLQTCSMNGGGGGGGPGLGPGFIPQIPGSGSMGGMRESPAFSPQISSQAPGVADGAGFGAQAMGGNAAGLGPGTGFGQQGVAGNGEGRAVSGGGGGVGTPAAPSLLPGVPDDATDETRHTHVQKQQRWLLYLRHCAKCHVPGNECSLKQQCKFGKQLWQHILSCQETECPFPRCTTSKELLKHHQRCQVCLLTKLSFEPPVIYCTQCANKIKRGQTYYSTPPDASNDIKGSWCHNCYQEPKGDKLNFDGAPLKKTDLMKRKNDEEIEEAWVQCDHCEYWVHQTCGMFNKGKNNPDVRYLCPDCLLQGMRLGRRQRIETRPQSMLEAKDLPRCQLSDQLQERLDHQLNMDWNRRAQEQGNSVLRADPITVRVINSVMKKCEVRHAFAESFRNEGYPTEFPYRQRVILLFQNLDGVDVCLFCLYVQEYGKDCPAPNTNCVYLSYLDSIKYFRPEVPAAGGVPSVGLRTFAYHQLLIAYLAYIKKLGFEQMYIWACPPMAGDDYILYCHPSKQKTPRSDRLRQWYLEMLKTAQQEGIVKHITTLWDTYFEGGKDHRLERCSAAHIPYLEGDYWPGEAENLLTESLKAASKSNKKGSGVSSGAGGGGSGAGRAAAKGKRYGSGPTTADELLMGRLGEILGGNMKEDFIVVHLTEVCTFCRAHLKGGAPSTGGYRSSTPLKPAPVLKFEGIKIEQGPSIPINAYHQLSICENCYQDEKHRAHTQQVLRLPTNLTTDNLSTSRVEDLQPHQLLPDTDIDIDNEFFETRQTFLSLCQGNHYQFDTLRRAKHSSMMVLYHLHNPSAPAFTTSCNVCQSEIEPGAGFRCTVCTDFDICGKCKSTIQHPHPFMAHVIKPHETQMRLTDSERRERHEQLQRTMALLIHACSCHSALCASNSCRKVKALMAHAMECVPSVSGGCQMCRKMWVLLNLHSKCCNKAVCSVPRCSELKEMRRRQTSRQEELRRSAYTTMAQQQ